MCSFDLGAQRPTLGLLTQPKRTDQGDFRTATGRLAFHRARPDIGNRFRSIWIGRVDIDKFVANRIDDLGTDSAQLVGDAGRMGRYMRQDYTENKARHRIQIGCEGVAV